MPELWGNKVRQLDVRIGLVGAFWQYIVVQCGTLLTLQQQSTQIGALRGMLHLFSTHLNAIELPQSWGNDAIGGASKFAYANEVVACVINAPVDNGIHPVIEIRLTLKDEKQKRPHGHMATSQRKGIARIRLRQIGWQLEALAVHGIRRLSQRLGKSLDPLAEF